MEKTHLTVEECMSIIGNMAKGPYAFTDEIPEVLQKDFHEFIVGKALSTIDGRETSHDIKEYYDKLMTKGISYPVQWKVQSKKNEPNTEKKKP